MVTANDAFDAGFHYGMKHMYNENGERYHSTDGTGVNDKRDEESEEDESEIGSHSGGSDSGGYSGGSGGSYSTRDSVGTKRNSSEGSSSGLGKLVLFLALSAAIGGFIYHNQNKKEEIFDPNISRKYYEERAKAPNPIGEYWVPVWNTKTQGSRPPAPLHMNEYYSEKEGMYYERRYRKN